MNPPSASLRHAFSRARKQQGSATIEAALLLPILLLILWLGSELIYYVQLQHRLHRATAALAEVLANPPIGPTEELSEQLNRGADSWMEIFPAMLTDRPRAQTAPRQIGLRVRHLRSRPPEAENTANSILRGSVCSATAAPTPNTIYSGGMRPQNTNQFEWIMVESCIRSPARWPGTTWIFPTEISSHFIAVRK